MSEEIIGFKKDGKTDSGNTVVVNKKSAAIATVKYSTSANLPDTEDKSVLIYTTDTGEFFEGQGYASALKKLNTDNVVFENTKNDFPADGSKSKLYVAKDNSTIYAFTDTGYVAVSGGQGSVIDPAAFAKLQTDVAAKATKTDLDSYRKIADAIRMADLDSVLAAKINSIPAAFDDTALKAADALLQTNKADKTELDAYRLKAAAIAETDLDTALAAKINSATPYNDTVIKTDIASLKADKADRTDLTNYRLKADVITAGELDSAVQTKLNDAVTAANGVATLNTDVSWLKANMADKAALALKADASALNDYRDKATKIAAADLDQTLADEISKAAAGATPYDDTAVKASITSLQTSVSSKAEAAALDGYRQKATAITEADLDSALQTKIDSKAATYDDTTVKADIAALQTNKADKTALDAYRQKATAITEADLDAAAQTKLNAVGATYNDTQVKSDITSLQTAVAAKADKTALDSYRLKSTAIAETDLDSAVQTKLNAAGTVYNDTQVKADITALQTNKADKTELANYRQTATAIKESDLDSALATKINTYTTGSGVSLYEYEAVDSTNGECWVVATGTGVKFTNGLIAKAIGGGTTTYPMKSITIPEGVKVISARIRFYNTEISETSPGCAVDWDATQADNTDNNFVQPLCDVWNDAVGNRTKRSCAQSQSVNNHTVTFTGIATGGATGVGCLVKLIY